MTSKRIAQINANFCNVEIKSFECIKLRNILIHIDQLCLSLYGDYLFIHYNLTAWKSLCAFFFSEYNLWTLSLHGLAIELARSWKCHVTWNLNVGTNWNKVICWSRVSPWHQDWEHETTIPRVWQNACQFKACHKIWCG